MLEEKVLQTITNNNLINSGDCVILGVSGGPDSTCLLDIFLKLQKELNFRFVVAHINHKIRKEAIKDQEYVQTLCKKNNISCYIKHADITQIAKQQKTGIEETGRKIRYEFFEEIAKKIGANKIATAHNKNDKVETILMNLIRGSGISGLKGIRPVREKTYIKPLIECTKQEIEQYCIKKELNPQIDKTNFDNTYTRNRIRNELIPYLQKEFNPQIIETISKMGEIITREDEYIQKQMNKEYKQIIIQENEEKIVLDLKKFNNLETVIKNRIILYTINKLFNQNIGIETKHIKDIIKLCKRNIGNKYLIPNKKVKILIKNHQIFFINNSQHP